jgi:hypothetical protein
MSRPRAKFDTSAHHTRGLFPYGWSVTVMDRKGTDKRTDDLADRVGRLEANVDKRFDKVDARFDRLEGEVKAGFATVAVESKAASAKLDASLGHVTYAVWAGLIVLGISKFLFG